MDNCRGAGRLAAQMLVLDTNSRPAMSNSRRNTSKLLIPYCSRRANIHERLLHSARLSCILRSNAVVVSINACASLRCIMCLGLVPWHHTVKHLVSSLFLNETSSMAAMVGVKGIPRLFGAWNQPDVPGLGITLKFQSRAEECPYCSYKHSSDSLLMITQQFYSTFYLMGHGVWRIDQKLQFLKFFILDEF